MKLIPRLSLLITTYNHPDFLGLVLETVARQSRVPDQIVVCDDGSSPETCALIREWANRLPIRHAWQPDCEFRAARSRNLGVSKSDAEYVIMIDGDCLLPPNFVYNHIRLSEPGYLVAGGRMLLADLETRALLNEVTSIGSAFRGWKFRSFPLGALRDLRPGAWKTVRTCNLGLYKKDLDAVGGFDESYVGWGREDSDFVIRLIHRGVKVRFGRFGTCVAHLHHCEGPRDQLSENDSRFNSGLNDLAHIHPKLSVLIES